jgi:glucose-1-phosphate cytidylyltransferase
MKAVILAGGHGTRISEESGVRPKPMVEIGNKPILWHILKIYSHFGINDFIICCGHKSNSIKEYFSNYFLHNCDISFDLRNNTTEFHTNTAEPWRVTLVDTGENTMTGGRLRRVQKYIGNETFCLTYGDGVTDLNISKLIDFHYESGAKATLTAVQAPGRFGAFTLREEESRIKNFKEKIVTRDMPWINGGYFVCEPSVIDLIKDDSISWESEPLETLAATENLVAFRHHGFWQCMDSLRDKHFLENVWESGNAPWKHWDKVVEMNEDLALIQSI